MASIKLYKRNASPAVRATLLTANALNITFEEHDIDFIQEEHKTPQYLKMNPLHTVPTLDDNGIILYDSHVINTYLVGKYGKNDSLYPKGLYHRALVDQKLAFDLGTLFPLLITISKAYLKKEITSLTPKMVTDLKQTYHFMETMLQGKQWVAINRPTIADFSCYTTISCLDFNFPINGKMYPNLKRWFDCCRDHSLFSKDAENAKLFATAMTSIST